MGIELEYLWFWMELVPGCQVSAGIESLGGEDSQGNLGAWGGCSRLTPYGQHVR